MQRFIERSVSGTVRAFLGEGGSRQAHFVDGVADNRLTRKATRIVTPVVAFTTLAAIGTLNDRGPRKIITAREAEEGIKAQQQLNKLQGQQKEREKRTKERERQQELIRQERKKEYSC